MSEDQVIRDAPDLVSTGVQELVSTAQRLGLTWVLRPGTVQSAQSSSRVQVICDGDSQEITMVSLVGLVQPLSRVMVLQIPPAGNFVVGSPMGLAARQLMQRSWAPATSDVTLTAAAQLMPGTEITVNTTGSFEYEATAFFDFDATAAGTTRCIGELFVNGAAVSSVANFDVTIADNRANVGQQWVGTARGGSTFDIRVRRTAAAGTQVARLAHTTLLVRAYQ